MSTGIFQFNSSGPGILENILGPSNALWFFLILTLPLVLVTFVAWGITYRWKIYNGRRKQMDREEDPKTFYDAA